MLGKLLVLSMYQNSEKQQQGDGPVPGALEPVHPLKQLLSWIKSKHYMIGRINPSVHEM
eukprot:CAMPEP_0202369516 /NCGR_PEP_ID=MMETSP1127-20130417/1336_1 /ASSEMBLY_ACC=CAM_ASM_000462 /TAXON_ID=3047 /ORGANISM="Dunaliella tertiolecta, Strain CCMP1320" /LENGTH=58 /DNA_ID=CAMNT_0048965195 /DNA_START=1378 /DNA_END=1554 /DNA_ORIENTATION=+